MADRPFVDHASKPTEPALEAALGDACACYRSILGLASSFVQEWTFSKRGGWMLKVHDRNKALLYLTPLNDEFKMSLAIREGEREAFLRDPELAAMHGAIESARKYPEGFGLHFDVDGRTPCDTLESLVGKLVARRRS